MQTGSGQSSVGIVQISVPGYTGTAPISSGSNTGNNSSSAIPSVDDTGGDPSSRVNVGVDFDQLAAQNRHDSGQLAEAVTGNPIVDGAITAGEEACEVACPVIENDAAAIVQDVSQGVFLLYQNITKGNSVLNLQTNVTRAQAEQSMIDNGFVQAPTTAKNISTFRNGGDLYYTLRDTAKSYAGSTMDVVVKKTVVCKIFLGGC